MTISVSVFETQKEEPLFSALPSIDYHMYFPAIKMKKGEEVRNLAGFFCFFSKMYYAVKSAVGFGLLPIKSTIFA